MKKISSFMNKMILIGGLIFCVTRLEAAPAITSLEGVAAGGNIFLKSANNVTIVGTADNDGDTVTVWVNGAMVGTTPAQVYSNGTAVTCDFDSLVLGAAQTLEIRADHLGTITASVIQNFLVDTTLPDVPNIHWSSPTDGAFVSTALGNISATATDTGGAGVDFASCTITVSGLNGTLNNNGTDIYFTPNGGWAAFQTNTLYTINATIRDRAGNSRSNSNSFTYDSTAPGVPAIHWSSPADGAFVSTALRNISATTTDAGGAGVNFAACTITVSGLNGTLNNNGTDIYFVPSGGWAAFQTNTVYTINATIRDRAGNARSNSNSFTYDSTAPGVPAIHWSSPTDGAFVSTALGNISATATDAGGAGVNFSSCTITVSNMNGTINNNGTDIYFTPNGGWNSFANRVYTITAIIRDKAGNSRSSSTTFTYDSTPPNAPVIHWTNPADNPFWMGTRLNSIYATLNDTGGSGIDTTATTMTVRSIPGTKAVVVTQITFTPVGPGNYTSRFVTGNFYSMTVTAIDRAGNRTSSYAGFAFDGNSPNASSIHWRDPYDGMYAGPNLGVIWTDTSGDTGGSGIKWNGVNSSNLAVSGIAASNSNNASSQIYFLPTLGYPTAFTHDILYTITSTIFDYAGNYIANTRQFRCDRQAPTLTIYWQSPDRGSPASYYMGQGLTRIWADINPTVTTTGGVEPMNTSVTAMSITASSGPNPAGSSILNGGPVSFVQWGIASSPYHATFTNGILYTVNVTVTDFAGNNSVASRQFMKDEGRPVINDVRISTPSTGITGNNIILRSARFPLSANYFGTDLTDFPTDWGGHTSLNGLGIGYHGLLPSDMRIFHETSGLVNTATAFFGSGTAYQGTLTLPAAYTPLEGVYSVSVTARDWAHTSNTPDLHEAVNLSRILVDNTPPQDTYAAPPTGSFYVTGGNAYLRSTNLHVYPGNVTVGASDTPADRGYNFGHRLNFTNSVITLLNPDGNTRAVTFLGLDNGWTQPGPVITDLCNSYTASINTWALDAPIYPRPEYIGNTIEGRYIVNVFLEDRISPSLGTPNRRVANYYFFNDITPPRLLSWSPFSTNPLPDSYTSSFSDVQARIYDPNLRDGFAGAGLNLPACNVELFLALTDSSHPTGVWNTDAGAPGSGVIASTGPFIGPQGQSLNNQTVYAFKVGFEYNPGRKIYNETGKHSTAVNGSGGIQFTNLDPSSNYMVGWKIPSTYTQDASGVIGAIPITPILKNGLYFANCFTADMVGNTAQVESINFNYLSAGGPIYLNVTPHILLADGVTTAVVTTSAIHLSENPSVVVQDGTQVTVSSSLGDIITPDINPILPGVQLQTSGGMVSFTIRSRARQSGLAVLRAKTVSGFADSGNVSDLLEMVLAKMENCSVQVDPGMERMTARYTVTGNVNRILPLTAGVDKFTVVFPDDTGLPSNFSANVLKLNDTPIATVTIQGQEISFVVPINLAPSTAFTLLIPEESGVINPAAGHYQLSLQSTVDVVAALIPYNIMIKIDSESLIPAPNPCKTGRMRFFFNLDEAAQAELMILNLLGDRVSRVTKIYGSAKKGEVLDWNCQRIGPGVYWAILKLNYANGRSVTLQKQKVVILQ